jgi:6-phosphogluconolactonase
MASTVTAFAYDRSRGVLKELQTITTLPKGFTGRSTTAEVQVHPSGRYLYGSNRGHDSVAVFSIDEREGTLTLVEITPTQGKTPRNFGIDPTGAFLLAAHQDTDNVVVFRVDAKTGRVTPTGQILEVGSPVCVKFLPLG